MNQYEATIGIECHVQLLTKTKLFSGANNDARDAAPNTTISPVCLGLPGTLPVLNAEAVRLAIRAGIALNASIAEMSRFDRKHYFYPDLPKGYQITQLEFPTVGTGKILIPLAEGDGFEVGITRAHIEEDAGKLTHPVGADYSLVDLNRAGTPLVEIVSEPDMHTPEQAKAFAQELQHLMLYAGVSYANLYHGNMRFDVNISVAKKDSNVLGTRAEVKNLNSFKSIERAARYEFDRQVALLEAGETVMQETRGWIDDKQITVSQRSKEDAHDYRYFPDADIPPIYISQEAIENERALMPSLPPELRACFEEIGLDSSVIHALIKIPESARLVYRLVGENKSAAKRAAHWCASVAPSDDTAGDVAPVSLNYDQVVLLSAMVEQNKISSTAAKELFAEIAAHGGDVMDIAIQRNLLQVSDSAEIELMVDEILNDPASQRAINDVREGNDKAIGYLVGQAMKLSKGRANPAILQTIIRQKI